MAHATKQFTDEQRRAIEMRRTSVALSAGAGCGKTFVLTERFLAQLEPGDLGGPPATLFDTDEEREPKLHELIAITFTDRAAREMRDRIRATCYERLQQASPLKADYWLRLLRNLDAARVSTIHAFCGALLRTHAVEAQLDPRFTVVEQSQADTLLAEMVEDVLREKLSDQDPATMEVTVNFGLNRLQSLVSALLGHAGTIDFDIWLQRTPAEVVALWDRHRREVVVPSILRSLKDVPAARALLDVIGQLGDIDGVLRERCDAVSQLLAGLANSRDPAVDLEAIVAHARIKGAGKREDWPSDDLYDRFKKAAEDMREEARRTQEFLQFDVEAAAADAEAGLQFLALAHAVHERYEARKRELAWLDFNDLLVRARRLLTDPAHAELQRRLTAQVRLLLVDECQDTDPLQVELIEALCGPQLKAGKLFFVGDYKQAIYRFRGADPSVFRRLQRETPKAGRLPLTLNFRSQPAILEFVNALFCDALSHTDQSYASDGDDPLQYQPLRASRPQTVATPTVEFLWAITDDQNKSAAGAQQAARRKEADFIARRIRGMLDQREKLVADKQPDGKWTPRPVEQKDIALLFRALSDVQLYEEALRRWSINYYLVGGQAFYAQQEIYDVVNLLRSLASLADAVSLAGVLRSPMFALADETLFWLAQHPQGLGAGLFAARWPAEIAGPQRDRTERAAAVLGDLRSCKDRLSIASLLNRALALTGYDAALVGEFLGERKLANLRKLVEQARAFDQSGVLGLADFIVQLSQFIAKQPREPLAPTHPEGANVVRLMTIHQAKGLEFPVVFVPDIGRPSRGPDDGAAWSDALGPLVKIPPRRGKPAGISGLDLHRTLGDAEEDRERIRLLYVATTRAADYLVISSGVFPQEFAEPSAPWMKLLSARFDLQSGQCRAALPKGYRAPAIKVGCEPPPIDTAVPTTNVWRNLDSRLARVHELARGTSIAPKGRELWEPIAPDVAARRRYSVSRLTGQLRLTSDEGSRTVLLDDEPSLPPDAASQLGTLVHQVLSRVDFAGQPDVAALVKRCAELQGGRVLEHVAAAAAMIERFLQSARAGQLTSARVLHRELEFLVAWPPRGEMKAEGGRRKAEERGGLYLQGFIDCLYQDESEGWHLLDFKSNQLAAKNVAAAAAPYEMQLGVYALAVEQILGQPPTEIAVHFLRLSAEHRFMWNDQMRRRTIEQVNQAIDSVVNFQNSPTVPVGALP